MKNGEAYYRIIESKMTKEFKAMYKGTRIALSRHFNDEKIDRLYKESSAEYKDLWAELPYIGGKRNPETINIIMGAIVLAIICTLRKEKLTKQQTGEIIYKSFEGYFLSKPQFMLTIAGKLASTRVFQKNMKNQIIKAQQAEYADDFIIEFVEPDSGEFDFGYDYKQCALSILFKKFNAEDFLPYVCLGDFVLFHSLGIGFKRTATIANGAACCDFRFSKKFITEKGWPPEDLGEWKKR